MWRKQLVALGAFGSLLLASSVLPRPGLGQSSVPDDRIHLSVTLGGTFLLGVGYTHWIEEHHALELTAFPFAYPREGFPFGVRAGYGWVPSDEVWRAKLGANVTVMIQPKRPGRDRFSPIFGITPGIQYDPEGERSLRADLWMSYYVHERVFAPTGIELIHCWR